MACAGPGSLLRGPGPASTFGLVRSSQLRPLALALGLAAGLPSGVGAQFQAIETTTFRLVFTSPLQSYLVPQVAATFDNALRFHRRLFDFSPDGKINLMMHDLWHLGNAGARPVPEKQASSCSTKRRFTRKAVARLAIAGTSH